MKFTTAALTAMLFAGTLAGQTIQINKDNRTLAVTATDSAFALADLAVVHVGFEVYGADEQGAYTAGSQRSNAIVAALQSRGVAKDSIESQDQSLQPLSDYELQKQPPALKGMRFKLAQSWTVRTQPDKAAEVLDTAVKAGANQSGAIDWEMRDATPLEREAAAKALAHAQSIAAGMAEGLHTHVGALLYASNQAQEARAPMFKVQAMLMEPKNKMAQPLAISTRRVERSATVYAVFGLE